jgi:hypothetical protein
VHAQLHEASSSGLVRSPDQLLPQATPRVSPAHPPTGGVFWLDRRACPYGAPLWLISRIPIAWSLQSFVGKSQPLWPPEQAEVVNHLRSRLGDPPSKPPVGCLNSGLDLEFTLSNWRPLPIPPRLQIRYQSIAYCCKIPSRSTSSSSSALKLGSRS